MLDIHVNMFQKALIIRNKMSHKLELWPNFKCSKVGDEHTLL